jgi:hypothetical protein
VEPAGHHGGLLDALQRPPAPGRQADQVAAGGGQLDPVALADLGDQLAAGALGIRRPWSMMPTRSQSRSASSM